MKRFPAYDPPEYVDWSPDPGLQAEYRSRIAAEPERNEVVASLDRNELLGLYRELLRTRLLDIGLKRWVRQGVISKAWLGTGEEAVTVGSVFALQSDRDVVCPMIRNAGACHMMGMPLADVFRGYLATADSPSRGRDLHVGDPSVGVIQPVSQMGTNAAVMAGVALGFKRKQEPRVALTWLGDGATRTGICHEGVNLAGVQELPVVYVLQNNQVALGTRLAQHSRGRMSQVPQMYGIHAEECDGNNILDVYAASALAVRRCRAGEGPVMIVADTFRMGGHATHDEREARETFPAELFQHWGRRDPVGMFERYLVEEGVPAEELERLEEATGMEIDAAAEEALSSRAHMPAPEEARYEGFTEGGTLLSLDLRPS